MSEHNQAEWYKRKNDFAPYTRADGKAVAEELDSVQASFDLIPKMRTDGKGFAVSPVVPEPTEDDHAVPFKLLKEAENSVNQSRQVVEQKASQVDEQAQQVVSDSAFVAESKTTIKQQASTVAENTKRASDYSQSAEKMKNAAASSAEQAMQSESAARDAANSATNDAEMAKKWASHPRNQVVDNELFSAMHYALLAEYYAGRAKNIADGEVDYNRILNVPEASPQTLGVIKTYSEFDSDSENLSLSAKAGKKLKDLLDSLRSLLNNYIPNSKKSNAINSPSSDTVATSFAVKTAYDLAASKQSPATTLAGYGITDAVMVKGHQDVNLDQLLNRSAVWRVTGANKDVVGFTNKNIYNFGVGLTLASGPCAGMLYMPHATAKPKLYLKSSYTSYTPSPWAEVAMVDDVVNRSGDTMTGTLTISQATETYEIDSFRNWKWGVKFPSVMDALVGHTKCCIAFNNNGSFGIASDGTFRATFTTAGDIWTDKYGWLPSYFVPQDHLVGQVAYFATSTPPSGWLKANGAAVSRTTYAALFARIGIRFGAGDGSTTFNLPDLRGEFVRGWDDGRNIDAGRALGSHQGDAIRNITASVMGMHLGNINGALSRGDRSGVYHDGGTGHKGYLNFDASRVVPTASENRPRNIALLACIKY